MCNYAEGRIPIKSAIKCQGRQFAQIFKAILIYIIHVFIDTVARRSVKIMSMDVVYG